MHHPRVEDLFQCIFPKKVEKHDPEDLGISALFLQEQLTKLIDGGHIVFPAFQIFVEAVSWQVVLIE